MDASASVALIAAPAAKRAAVAASTDLFNKELLFFVHSPLLVENGSPKGESFFAFFRKNIVICIDNGDKIY